MQYPAFVLVAASGVMLFFLLFLLAQFSTVLGDFGGKSDTAPASFIGVSDFLRANATAASLISAATIALAWWLLRQARVRAALVRPAIRRPGP